MAGRRQLSDEKQDQVSHPATDAVRGSVTHQEKGEIIVTWQDAYLTLYRRDFTYYWKAAYSQLDGAAGQQDT